MSLKSRMERCKLMCVDVRCVLCAVCVAISSPFLTPPPPPPPRVARYDSISGTEYNQNFGAVKAASLSGRDPIAAELHAHGARFGRQFVVFRHYRALPAYVVRYTLV